MNTYAYTLAACLIGALSLSSFFEVDTSLLYSLLFRQPDISSHLSPLLSPNASISVPGDEDFLTLLKRWQWWSAPEVRAIVEVQNEQDVQQTILFANQHIINFFASVGGHGSTTALGKVKNGIQIRMRSLNKVEVSSDGTYATLGGGVKGKEVQSALWAQNKMTVTGGCECVGLTAVMLGGGHGFLQGHHGLLSDQLLSARIILANATALTVSEKAHPDLFWALQGAGHNFGIVTEYDYKIYPVTPENRIWSHEAYVFKGDKLNAVYNKAQEMMKTQPRNVMHYSLFLMMPDIDPVNPIILYHIVGDGSSEALQAYAEPIRSIGHVGPAISDEGEYIDVSSFMQIDDASFVCNLDSFVPWAGVVRLPIDIPNFNVTALEETYLALGDMMQRIPQFNGSFLIVEQYSTRGVQEVQNWDSSAFPWRGDNLLLAPVVVYPSRSPDGMKYRAHHDLDALAEKEGLQLREILRQGTGSRGMHSYVNYAHGGESQESLYGFEPWRLEKLRRLKKQYDPENRFGYYTPIKL